MSNLSIMNNFRNNELFKGFKDHVPTPEEIENDRLSEIWKEQRREEARKHFIRYHKPTY